MEFIVTILVMLVAVVFSNAISRALPVPVPLPLIQIMLGAVLAAFTPLGVTLVPEVFFLLFLPPLLFLDGWRIPKEAFRRDKDIILELAFGLVVFTVVGLGFFVHWMIPLMPLGVAFALAAILSPTDPVAVSSITQRVPMPKRLTEILAGESLFNDASGLVCMRFAVAAVLTGTLSLADATVTFAWLTIVGIGVGVGVGLIVSRVRVMVVKRIGIDSGNEILLTIMIPFCAYLLAEELQGSGILAAVAAGFTFNYTETQNPADGDTRIRSLAVWDMIQLALNGLMFVLLGEQLPKIVDSAIDVVSEAGHHSPLWLIVYAIAIYVALLVMRFVWAWVSLRLTLFRMRKRGQDIGRPGWPLLAASSLAGVRGSVTLAGVLTLPLFALDGSPFPARELAIFLAAAVIILSLVVAGIGLPYLLTGVELPADDTEETAEAEAQIDAAEAAIRAIDDAEQKFVDAHILDKDVAEAAAANLKGYYRQRIDALSDHPADDTLLKRETFEAQQKLWLEGLRAERAALFVAMRRRTVSQETVRKLIREIDLLEARLNDRT